MATSRGGGRGGDGRPRGGSGQLSILGRGTTAGGTSLQRALQGADRRTSSTLSRAGQRLARRERNR